MRGASPQHHAPPESSRAQVCCAPVLSATNVRLLATCCGSNVPLARPFAGEWPQHHTKPALLRAQACPAPAAMTVKAWSPETGTGDRWSLVSPLPS